jgi:hypothetical protein
MAAKQAPWGSKSDVWQWLHDQGDWRRVAEIAKALKCGAGAVTSRLNRLKGAGLAEWRRDGLVHWRAIGDAPPEDGRGKNQVKQPKRPKPEAKEEWTPYPERWRRCALEDAWPMPRRMLGDESCAD